MPVCEEKDLEKINEKIEQIKAELESLECKRLELIKNIEAEKEMKNTEILLGSVFDINSDNTIRVKLLSDTKTTPIMDRFDSSNKTFLIFESIYSVIINSQWKHLSLVIAKNHKNVLSNNSQLTMTDLKKSAGMFITLNLKNRFSKNDRMYSLYNELFKIIKNFENSENIPKIISFKTPCRIGGQTFKNRSGYGSEYCGEDLVYQGTLYGETTSFLIIGAVLE